VSRCHEAVVKESSVGSINERVLSAKTILQGRRRGTSVTEKGEFNEPVRHERKEEILRSFFLTGAFVWEGNT